MMNYRFNIFTVFSLFLIFFGSILFAWTDEIGMDPALKHSAEGMQVYENSYDAMMNNAVNSNTPGYKQVGMANVRGSSGLQNVVFYRFSQGVPVQSGGSLDFIIEGSGFFVLKCPWGYGYTRDGRFTLDGSGRLVTFDNKYPVMGESGEIYLVKGNISVQDNGAIFIDSEIVDVLKVVNFARPELLKSLNGSIFYFENPLEEQYIQSDFSYAIKRGYYEASNVNITQELSIMPVIKNAYDANTKAMKMVIKSLNSGISIGSVQ